MSKPYGNLQKYQSSNPLQRFLIARFLRKVGSLVAALPVAEVLDVGCAESFVSRYLAGVAGLRLSFAGVDIDAAALKRGQAVFPQMLRSFGNITALPFATEQFDLVLCTEVLEHLPEPLLGLRELRRVTRGYCLLSVPHEPWFRALNFLRGKHVRQGGNDPEHLQNWTGRRFAAFVSREFEVISAQRSLPWYIVLGKKR
ncbi:MAG: class I SAM-dependent methyltransferase [Anaerolineae bacterium]|nr:class I SAM-dependent methyltransferase [Anaerolineae bacterium]